MPIYVFHLVVSVLQALNGRFMDIKTICLAILAQEDATGYEIQKAIKDGPLAYFFDASFGSIYPALARLTEEELITCRVVSESGKPERKIYSILPKGRLQLSRALGDISMMDRVRSPFLAAMLFSGLMSPRELYRLIEGRIDMHRAVLDHLETAPDRNLTAGEKFVQGYARAIHEAALDYLEKHRTDLEGELLITGLSPEMEESRG